MTFVLVMEASNGFISSGYNAVQEEENDGFDRWFSKI